MIMSRLITVLCFAALVSAAPASAQTGGAPSEGMRGRVFVHFEGQSMTAKDSFDAVLGSGTMMGPGLGAEVQGIWRNLFARVDASLLKKTGERVFVFEGDVFPLGVPVDITMTPIEAAVGWRFKPFTSRAIVPYVGGGMLFLKYKEETEGDASSENVSESYSGPVLFAGIDAPVWKYISAGAELGWRKATVKNPGGAMSAFGEDDLGGVTFRVMVSFRK
jgi:hypothetical protein